jgi:NAD(P)H-dependent FMN reductase
MTDIVLLVGSLRKVSLSRRAARALAALAPASLRLEIVRLPRERYTASGVISAVDAA